MSKIMKKISAFIEISRPANVIIGIFSVFVAIYITKITPQPFVWISVAITAACFTAGANAINDVYDVEIDKINRPDRPLPAGKLTQKEAVRFSLLCFFFGFIPNVWLSWWNQIIAVIAIIFLILYTPYLKKRLILGNLLVSFITGLAFVYGAAAAGKMSLGIYPAIIAFFIHLTREIIKDLEDREGDKKAGATTLAVMVSVPVVHKLIALLFVLDIGVIAGGYFWGFFNQNYLFITSILIIPFYLFFMIKYLIQHDYIPEMYSSSSLMLKISMLIGIVAFYLGI
ncbi:MAG: UbiA family prenyltransferase [Calditrichia bacterium]